MNFYQRYIGDYQRDTADLSLAEHGAYTMLLDTYFSTEKPLDFDYKSLYRICRAMDAKEKAAVRVIADRFFPVSEADGKRHNERADREIAKAQPKMEAAKRNGKKGGRPPKTETQQKPSGFSGETQQEPSGKAHQNQNQNKDKTPPNPPEGGRALKSKPDSGFAREQVVEVFEHWQSAMDTPKSKLDGKREALIRKALALGYSTGDLKLAVDGCRMTPHNMGVNDRGTKFNGLDLILRSADHIDRFTEVARQGGPKPVGANGPISGVGYLRDRFDTSWAAGLVNQEANELDHVADTSTKRLARGGSQ